MIEVLLLLFPPLLSVFIVIHHLIFDEEVETFRLLLYVFFLFVIFTTFNNLISISIFKFLFKPSSTFVQFHLADPIISLKYFVLATLIAFISGLVWRIFQLYGSIELYKTPRNIKPPQKGIK